MKTQTILLNPGPVTLTERVRTALTRPDMCHREQEFADLCISIKQRVSKIYANAEENYETVLLSGSGTCAVEAMLNTLAPRQSTTLVVTNGVYGERMSNMLQAAHRPYVEIKGEWQNPIDLATVEQHLQTNQSITHVVTVHNETTTGRLNALSPLAELCQKYHKSFMIDAVSSFAGEDISFQQWQPLAVAATANKCLHAVPGMAFVLVQRTHLENATSEAQTLYLDLFRYYQAQLNGFSPFTQAVHAAFALDEALNELADSGGWRARHQRYLTLSHELQTVLPTLGMPLYLDNKDYSAMITSFHLPKNWTYPELHDLLKSEGFVIYAGQGNLQSVLFRIANMGDISDADWQRLIHIFRHKVCHHDEA
ncbi:MAG TPA: 2-aminoethylphosphonate--pyruvate transaminase [Gammaproteobacteria bacterium]|nr:2-aminoethylphosphonate--pyruvate transaminase [Gammaproteobacteria bacterium]